jgi:hypothetical protein
MVAFNRKATCGDAEPYYYEFLLGSDTPAVPESIAAHIRSCRHCAGQIRRLREELTASEAASGGGENDRELADALGRHFAHLGQEVSCTEVKPFLPALLQTSPEIRIPTPITVHMDHCAQCAEDMRSIAFLNLSGEQLTRLSRVLQEETPKAHFTLCRQVEAQLADLAGGDMGKVNPKVLAHVSVCPHCRARVYQYREKMLKALRDAPPEAGISPCDHISTAEIFDCVVPYGRASGTGLNGIAAHLRRCPECLEKVQALHRTLYGIAERADSETVTVYATKDGPERRYADATGRYEGYPIDVRVLERKPKRAPIRLGTAVRIQTVLKRGLAGHAVRPIAKAAVLVAAMIPLMIVFLVHTESASGTNPEDVLAAFGKAANVHVRIFPWDRTEPAEELWGSRTLDCVMLTEPGKRCELYDLRAAKRTVFDLKTGTPRPMELSKPEIKEVRRFLERYSGLTLTDVPADRQWRQVAHDEVQGTDTYELTWQADASNGSPYFEKWEVVVASYEKLPLQRRLFHKYSADDGWKCQSRSEFEYPTEEAVRSAIAAHFTAQSAIQN